MKLKKESQGFTLIEVLVALTILAIALMAITLTVSRSLKTTNLLRNKIAANCVAMNVISSMEVGLLRPPINGTQTGESDCLGRTFEWTVGVDQPGNHYYERVYIDIREKNISATIQHTIGFVEIHP